MAWQESYGELDALRQRYAKPYGKAVAPVVTAIINDQTPAKRSRRKTCKILTVGGGKGSFSRILLPEIREALERIGNRTKVEVVETDLASVVAQAQGAKARASFEDLPFKKGSFDIVLAESSLQDKGRKEFTHRLGEIARVLNPHGSLVNIADHVPCGMGGTHTASSRAGMIGLQLKALAAHQVFHQELQQAAERTGFVAMTKEVTASVTVKPEETQNPSASLHAYEYGIEQQTGGSGKLKESMMRYSGFVTVATRDAKLFERIARPRR